MRKYYPYYLIVIITGIFSCSESLSPDPASLGYAYFPLKTGDMHVYEVVRIDHKPDLTSDTTKYQMMEVVGDKFISGGEESYKIERYTRLEPMDEWQIEAVWSARLNTYQAIVVEDNVPIIKLSFPLEENRRWDGNAMNTLEFDEFKMVNLGQPYALEILTFTSTVEMVKEDAFDPSKTTTDNYKIEVFAKDVGMIYRHDIERAYCNANEDPCQSGDIAFGLEMEYKLIEYQLVD